MQHGAVIVTVRALRVHKCCTVVHGFRYVLRNFLRVRRDDGKIFAAADVLDNSVNKERLRKQSEHGEKSCFCAEYEERRERYERINAQKRFAYVERRVFPKYQCKNVRAAGGAVLPEYESGADRCQKHCVYKLQKRLVRKRRFYGHGQLQKLGKPREKQTAVYGADARRAAEYDKSYYEHQNIDYGDPVCRRKKRDLAQQCADTADSACREAVGDLEKVYARGHYDSAEGHVHIFL